MPLRETFQSREELEKIITAFDQFTWVVARLGNQQVTRLPIWARLTDYFIANTDTSGADTVYQLSADSKFSIDEHPNTRHQSPLSQNELRMRFGDSVVLEHGIHTSGEKRLYRENLWIISGEPNDDPQVALYSGGTCFCAGHDFNEINGVGSIIYGGEGMFKGFKSRNRGRLTVDGVRGIDYSVTPSLYELTITPKYEVGSNSFRSITNDVIAITNQVLGILREDHGFDCRDIRVPEVAGTAA